MLSGCGTKVWDDEPVRVISVDVEQVCFYLASEARDICMPAEDAADLVDLEPGTCALVDSYKNTGAVGSARQFECDDLGIED